MPVASELLVKVNADVSNLTSGLNQADKQVSGFAKSAGALGSVATAGFVALGAAAVGLGVGIASSVSKAIDFQQGIADVGALVGATTEQIQQLSDAALQLGQDTTLSGIGATDAAAAMAELAAAGFSVEDMTGGVTRGVLLLASATGTDVARAAEIAGDSFNVFRKSLNLTAKDMPKIADLFTGVANVSSISLDDLGESMKYIGPVAASMGLSLEDVTAAIAELGNQGIKGSQAGTSLRSIISSLAKPSKQAQKAMNDLGLEFFDTNGKMKDFAGISGELKSKLSGLTDEQRASTLVTLFGNEALSAANVLYGEGSEGIQKYIKDIAAQGNAAAIGAQRNNTLRGSIESFKGALETAQITLGKAFLPLLKSLTDTATGAVQAAIPLIEHWGPKLAAGLQTGIGKLAEFGGAVGGAVGALAGAVASFVRGDTNLGQLVGGVEIWVETILGKFGELAQRVKPYLEQFIKAAVTWLTGTALPQIVALGGQLAGALVGWITTTAIPFLATNLPIWGAALWGWITTTAVPAVAGAAASLAGAIGGWITGSAIPFLTTNLPIWGAALWDWITNTAVPTVVGRVVALAGAMSDWVTNTAVPYLVAKLPAWGMALWDWITNTAVPTVVGRVVGLAAAMSDWVTLTAIPYLQAKLPEWGAALWDWITNVAVPTVVGRVVGLAAAMSDWVTTVAIPYLQEKIPQWGQAIYDYITLTAVPTVTGLVVGLANAMSDWITTLAVPQVIQKMPEWGTAVGNAILDEQDTINVPIEKMAQDASVKFVDALARAGVSAIPTALSQWQGAILVFMGGLPAIMAVGAALATKAFVDNINIGLKGGLVAFAQWEAQAALAFARMVIPFQVIGFQIGAALIKHLYDAIKDGTPAVLTWMEGLGGKISDAMGDVTRLLYQKGKDIVQGLLDGIASLAGQVATAISNLATGIPDIVKKLLDSHSPSRVMADIGQDIVMGLVEGMDEKQQEAAKKAAEVASAVAKAVTDVIAAMRTLARVNLATDTPSGEAIGWFTHLTNSIVVAMQEAAQGFDKDALDAIGAFSDTVGKVGGAIKNAVDGLTALGKTNWANASPDGNAMAWFTHLIGSLVATFAAAASTFEDGALDEASAFADAIGKVGGSIKGALDGLAALASAKWADISPSGSAMSWFTHLIASLVQNFATASAQFAEGALDAASDFADSAGKVGGSVKGALDGLAALASAQWADISPSGSSMAWFTHLIAALVQNFATASAEFKEGALGAASDFAESAGKVMGVIGPAVEGFGKLANLAAPSDAAISALAAGIRSIVQKFADMASMLDSDGTKATGDFAAAANAALGAAKTGVELFAAMAGDKDKAGNNQPIGIPSATAIDQLMAGIRYVVQKFADMATMMQKEGIAQMQTFAAAAGQVLAAAKSGTDLFKQMEKLAVPSEAAIDYLLGTIGLIISKIRLIAAGIGTDGLAEATAFATGSFNVISTLANGLKLFDELAKFKDIPATKLEELWKALEGALDFAHQLFLRAEAIKAEAASFADSMKEAARLFAEGQSLGNGMGGAVPTFTPTTYPALAAGGIVTKPTLAFIGEAGPEAVVPLSRYQRAGGGGGGVTIQFLGPVYSGPDFDRRVAQAKETLTRRGAW